jgi:hypothetical protein
LPQPRPCACHRRRPHASAQRHRGDVGGVGFGRSRHRETVSDKPIGLSESEQ